MLRVAVGGAVVFTGLNIWNCNEKFFRNCIMPLVRKLDPETSHKAAVIAMKYCMIKKQNQPDPASLVSCNNWLLLMLLLIIT